MLISSLSRVYFCSGEVYSDFLFLMWAFPLSEACFQIADMLLKYQQFEESNVRFWCWVLHCTDTYWFSVILCCRIPWTASALLCFQETFQFQHLFFFLSSLESKDLFCLFHSCVVITPHWNIHSTLRLCTEPSPTWTAFPHSYQQLVCRVSVHLSLPVWI